MANLAFKTISILKAVQVVLVGQFNSFGILEAFIHLVAFIIISFKSSTSFRLYATLTFNQ